MKIPCFNHVDCECEDLTLTNFSSAAPDRIIYFARSYGFDKIPPIPNPDPQSCTIFGRSLNSLSDAEICANVAYQECVNGVLVTQHPCNICHPTGSGSIRGGFGFGFAVAGPTDEEPQDPCCDPDVPAECCCTTEEEEQDEDGGGGDGGGDGGGGGGGGGPGGGGGGGGGGATPEKPGRPPDPTLFVNAQQTCNYTCPDGSSQTITVVSGRFAAESQELADRKAKSACEDLARNNKICLGAIARQICVGVGVVLPIPISSGPDVAIPLFIQVVSGQLPPGLLISGTTIAGFPAQTGDFIFKLRVTSNDSAVSVEKTYQICVVGITPRLLPNAIGGGAGYTATLQATSCATGTRTWSIVGGSLPVGLTLNPATGVLSGTVAGFDYTNTFRVRVQIG